MDEAQLAEMSANLAEEPLPRADDFSVEHQGGMILRVDEAENDTDSIDSLPGQSGERAIANESTAGPIQTLMTPPPSSPPTANTEPKRPHQVVAEAPQEPQRPIDPSVDSDDLGPLPNAITPHMQPTATNEYAELLNLNAQQHNSSPSNTLADMLGLTNFAMFGGISVDPSPSPHLPLSFSHKPSTLCNDPECPIDGEHPMGMYLHKGEMPHAFNGDFGYSDPPPEVWCAWARIEELRGGEAEFAMVNGFAKCHWWNGE